MEWASVWLAEACVGWSVAEPGVDWLLTRVLPPEVVDAVVAENGAG